METSSFNPPKSLSEEGKWLLAVTIFEATNYVSNTFDGKNSFSKGTPGYWRVPNYIPDGITDRVNELSELRSQNPFELQVSKKWKKGFSIRNRK